MAAPAGAHSQPVQSLTATARATGGLNLAGGCFSVNGTCVGSGNGTVSSGLQGQFPFYNANGTTLTGTSSLFIAQSGNIGIGTTSPTINLDVNGPIRSSNNFADLRLVQSNGTGFRWALTNDGTLRLQRATDNTFSSAITPLLIDATGNVGIGTTTPNSNLEVSGTQAEATASGSSANGILRIGQATAGASRIIDFGVGVTDGYSRETVTISAYFITFPSIPPVATSASLPPHPPLPCLSQEMDI